MNGCPCQFVYTCFIPMHVGKPSSCKWLHHDYQGELLLVALGWFPFINGPSNLPSSHITPNGDLQGTHWIFHLYIYGYFIHCDETVKKVWFWYPFFFFCLVHCKHLKEQFVFFFFLLVFWKRAQGMLPLSNAICYFFSCMLGEPPNLADHHD